MFIFLGKSHSYFCLYRRRNLGASGMKAYRYFDVETLRYWAHMSAIGGKIMLLPRCFRKKILCYGNFGRKTISTVHRCLGREKKCFSKLFLEENLCF